MTEKLLQLIERYKHINWALLDQALVSGTNFLTAILVARYLGVEDFGKFSLVWMVVLFMNGLQVALVVSPITSIGPKIKKGQRASYFGAAFLQQLLLALFLSGVLFLGIKVSTIVFPVWGLEKLIIVLPAVGFFYLAQDFIRRYFFVLSKFKEVFINDVISCLGRLVLLTVLFNSVGATLELTFWIIAGTAALAWMVGLICMEKTVLSWIVFRQTALRHWAMSKWLVSSVIVQWLAGNIFVIAAAAMLGASAAGALKAMQNLLGLFNVLFSALENIIPVRAAVIYSGQDETTFISYLIKVATWGGIVTMGCMVVVVIFPKYWIDLFYGEQYLQYGDLLLGYGVVYLLTFAGLMFRIAFRTVEHTRPIFQAYLFAAIISVVIFYPVVDLFGVQGAVIGLVIIQISILAWYLRTIKKEGMFGYENKNNLQH